MHFAEVLFYLHLVFWAFYCWFIAVLGRKLYAIVRQNYIELNNRLGFRAHLQLWKKQNKEIFRQHILKKLNFLKYIYNLFLLCSPAFKLETLNSKSILLTLNNKNISKSAMIWTLIKSMDMIFWIVYLIEDFYFGYVIK